MTSLGPEPLGPESEEAADFFSGLFTYLLLALAAIGYLSVFFL